MIDPTLLVGLRKNGLLREGHFAFRSGRHSAGLLDRDSLLADPTVASHFGYLLAKRFFTEHVDTVATPSIWGAGLAQWVGYFLEPRAKVVYATPTADGTIIIADNLVEKISGKRLLLVDNLVMTGDTMTRFAKSIADLGGVVVGIGTLWNASEPSLLGHSITGVLNTHYEAIPAGECPICASGASEPELIPY